MLQEEMGAPPVPFGWLMLGGEGRREQVFRPDPYSALVYQDPQDDLEAEAAAVYFESFSREAVKHLRKVCGSRRRRRDTFASNPIWCKPHSVWEKYFNDWLTTPDPQEAALATLFFDFRPVRGLEAVCRGLRARLTEQAQRQPIFLTHLAGDCVRCVPPLSFYRNRVFDRDGGQSARLDIKNRGLAPIVDYSRLMSMIHGVQETNTIDRLQLVASMGHISKEFFADIKEGYEFMSRLMLVHHLEMVENNQTPDNYLSPANLSELQKKTLKEIFAVINRMLAHIKTEFPWVV
jgi:CBS domain-containing protein